MLLRTEKPLPQLDLPVFDAERAALEAWLNRYRGRKDGEDCQCVNCADLRLRYSPKEAA